MNIVEFIGAAGVVVGVGFVGLKSYQYVSIPGDFAQACMYGDLAPFASRADDKQKFCTCFGERAQSRIGYLGMVTGSGNDPEFLSEVLASSAVECNRVHGS